MSASSPSSSSHLADLRAWRDVAGYDYALYLLLYPFLVATAAIYLWSRLQYGRWKTRLPLLFTAAFPVYLLILTSVAIPPAALTRHCPPPRCGQSSTCQLPASLALASLVEPTIAHLLHHDYHHFDSFRCFALLEPLVRCSAFTAYTPRSSLGETAPTIPDVVLRDAFRFQVSNSLTFQYWGPFFRLAEDTLAADDAAQREPQQRLSFLPLPLRFAFPAHQHLTHELASLRVILREIHQGSRYDHTRTIHIASQLSSTLDNLIANRSHITAHVCRRAAAALPQPDHHQAPKPPLPWYEQTNDPDIPRLQTMYLASVMYEAILRGILAALRLGQTQLLTLQRVSLAAEHQLVILEAGKTSDVGTGSAATWEAAKAAGAAQSMKLRLRDVRAALAALGQVAVFDRENHGAGSSRPEDADRDKDRALWWTMQEEAIRAQKAAFETTVRATVSEILGADEVQLGARLGRGVRWWWWQRWTCMWSLARHETACCPTWREWHAGGVYQYLRLNKEPAEGRRTGRA